MTFNWCQIDHQTEDNAWYETELGVVQCDHEKHVSELLRPNDLDVFLVVTEYRSHLGASFGKPQIVFYGRETYLPPLIAELLATEIAELSQLATYAHNDRVRIEMRVNDA